MREIKFRAWTGKKMFEVDVLAINGVGWDSGGTGVSLAYQPSIKVMQYTGIHDIKGKRVYEGDILYFVLYESDTNNRVVKFEDGQFVAELIRNGYSKPLKDAIIGTKVIGNIYENPELLEGLK